MWDYFHLIIFFKKDYKDNKVKIENILKILVHFQIYTHVYIYNWGSSWTKRIELYTVQVQLI